ncbi:hypothetical protein ACW4FQ_32125, partial [Escherichia coli]
MDRRPIYQAQRRCKPPNPVKQWHPLAMGLALEQLTLHSEAATILLVIDLVHVPLHQAVELAHGILDQGQRARQDPLEVATQSLLDPVRFG